VEDIIMYQKEKLDLRAFGQAVKEAREDKGLSKELIAERYEVAELYYELKDDVKNVETLRRGVESIMVEPPTGRTKPIPTKDTSL
jgi:hypothetical protein